LTCDISTSFFEVVHSTVRTYSLRCTYLNIVYVEELYDLFQDIYVLLRLQPSPKNNIVDVEELYDLFQDIYVLLRLQPSPKNNIVDAEELYDLFQDICVLLRFQPSP